MDIRQLLFFTTIVEQGYNLTRASKHLSISQPALSQMIRDFEQLEQVELFIRKHGRLTGLSETGRQLYEDAKIVLTRHQALMGHLRERSNVVRGKVRLGIPPRHPPCLIFAVDSEVHGGTSRHRTRNHRRGGV
ncbi:LysR family transcriptional regulator [Exiguobacterium sp. TBG-PICH-001]|uniref:LysR family transcriptional regulator n=1 Tax=Exiguobacterium abrahamii TaxID=2785532 RepID=UPI0018A790CB|nr:LysR family transcriptional regulator [Exiguobacterium sp. TBG-PICH-001]